MKPSALQIRPNTQRPERKQKLTHRVVFSILLNRPIQRRLSLSFHRPLVDIGSLLNQQFHHLDMSSTSSFVKWRPTVCILGIKQVSHFIDNTAESFGITLLSKFVSWCASRGE